MRKQKGFIPTTALIVLVILATIAGGVVVWQKRAPTKLIPSSTPAISPIPATNTPPFPTPQTKIPSPSPTPTTKKNCAVNGESPTNFDMTTGKFIPGGKPCCADLKAIGPKTPLDTLNKGVCKHVMGAVGVCRPCGDDICNTEYEDRCNCPEDCK